MIKVTKSFLDSFTGDSFENLLNITFTVITHANNKKEFIKNKIGHILRDNGRADEKVKKFWEKIIKTDNISLFMAPKNEGPILKNPNISEGIEKVPYYINLEMMNQNKQILSKLHNSEDAKQYMISEILPYFENHLYHLLNIAMSAMIDCDLMIKNISEPLQNNEFLIKEWLKFNIDTGLNNIANVDVVSTNAISGSEAFYQLTLHKQIVDKFTLLLKEKDHGIVVLSKMLNFLSSTHLLPENKSLLKECSVTLMAQNFFLEFLYEVIDKDKSAFEASLLKSLESAKDVLENKLWYELLPNISVEKDMDSSYYKQLIKYCDAGLLKMNNSHDIDLKCSVYNKMISCNYELGQKSKVIKSALESISLKSDQPILYNILGQFLFSWKKYETAVKSYKIVSNTYEMQISMNDGMLISEPKNPEIIEKCGDHLSNIDCFLQAISYYRNALGLKLALDKEYNALLEKINNCKKSFDEKLVLISTPCHYELIPQLTSDLNELLGNDSFLYEDAIDG